MSTFYSNYMWKSRVKCINTFINNFWWNFIPLFNNGFFKRMKIGYPLAFVYILLQLFKFFLVFQHFKGQLACVSSSSILHEQILIMFCEPVHFTNHFLQQYITVILRIFPCIWFKKKIEVLPAFNIATEAITCFFNSALVLLNFFMN